VVGVAVLDDGAHVVDVVPDRGLEAVGRVRHGGYAFCDTVLKESAKGREVIPVTHHPCRQADDPVYPSSQ
jgi:hypothetical protein